MGAKHPIPGCLICSQEVGAGCWCFHSSPHRALSQHGGWFSIEELSKGTWLKPQCLCDPASEVTHHYLCHTGSVWEETAQWYDSVPCWRLGASPASSLPGSSIALINTYTQRDPEGSSVGQDFLCFLCALALKWVHI